MNINRTEVQGLRRKVPFALCCMILLLCFFLTLVGIPKVGAITFVLEPETPKVEPGLSEQISSADPEQRYSVWVFFTDKGFTDPARYEEKITQLKKEIPKRTLRRRSKCLSEHKIVDFRDLPVCSKYVEAVKKSGAGVKICSRWLNGISVSATKSQIQELANLPFVCSIEGVRGFRRREPAPLDNDYLTGPVPDDHTRTIRPKALVGHSIDYGQSLGQLAQIRVPELHDKGYHGEGVRVCLLDSGFGNLAHEAFSGMEIVASHDFLEGDEDVSGDDHGTHTLSIIGGFSEGRLVGPAFGAEFLLARTEDVTSETPIEEDYWIAGLEWAERQGADVVNSSLCYFEWDEGTGIDYTWEDLDGDHGRTTIAADIAASKGVVVVNAAGNEGPDGYIGTPADGDSVITVGAVDAGGNLAGFNSRGPTYDGRIKPDVVAQGVGVVCADGTDPTGYLTLQGTSLSTPLVTGVCALLLQIHPNWDPYKVAEALRRTATDLGDPGPDNRYGWGLVNASLAAQFEPELVPPVTLAKKVYNYPNPFSDDTNIWVPVKIGERTAARIFTTSGELVCVLDLVRYEDEGWMLIPWDGKNQDGRPVASGIYIYRIEMGRREAVGKMAVVR